MIIASEYFRVMASGPWKESRKDPTSLFPWAAYSWSAEEWSQKALELTLLGVHGKLAELPQQLELDVIANIAFIVDYYGLRKSFVFISDIWIKPLLLISDIYFRETILCLEIALIFNHEGLFKFAASQIMRKARDRIDTLGIHIPSAVTGQSQSPIYLYLQTIITLC